MKTNTNIKRRVKHSIKHRAQRKYKTHKNKHTKTQLKQYKTHRGGAVLPGGPQLLFSEKLTNPPKKSSMFSFFSSSKKTQDASLPVTTEKLVSLYDKEKLQITPDNINSFINDHNTIIDTTPDFKNKTCTQISFEGSHFFNITNENRNIIIAHTQAQITQENKLLSDAIHIITKVYTSITHLRFGTLGRTQNSNLFILDILSEYITNLTQLQTLILINCETLKTLPDAIGSLVKLSTLYLENCNALTKLPDTIGNLKSLKFLALIGCIKLTTLPDTIGKLTTLNNIELRNHYRSEITFTLPLTIWLLPNNAKSRLLYNDLTLTNPEILYLMPKIELSTENKQLYLTNINSKDDYTKPISDIVDMLKLNPTDKDNYLKNIPYNLDPNVSICLQIDKFTKERTNLEKLKTKTTPPNTAQSPSSSAYTYFNTEEEKKAYMTRFNIKETDYITLFLKVGVKPT